MSDSHGRSAAKTWRGARSLAEHERLWAEERRQGSARFEKVLKALEDVPLSEFTVGQLRDLVYLVDRDWSTSGGSPETLEAFEKLVEERSRQLKHGMFVRYKNPKKGQHGKGIIASYPRRGSTLVRVKGPRGWDGWCRVDEVEIVPP